MSLKEKLKEMKPIEIAGFIAVTIATIWVFDNMPNLIRLIKSFFH